MVIMLKNNHAGRISLHVIVPAFLLIKDLMDY